MTAGPTHEPLAVRADLPDDGGHGTAVWSSPVWRERATAWADQELAAYGIRRLAESEQPHLRAWSTVLRLPTTAGSVWLKAPGPGMVSEVSLYPVLAQHAPEHVLVPYAVDVARGWLLLPDGGRVLALNTVPAQEIWLEALQGYAQLQLALVGHEAEILATGVEDHRPHLLPQLFDEALDGARTVTRSREDRELLERVAPARELVTRLAAELGESRVPATLQHDDLHRDNVFESRALVFDWGDAVLAHPFGSLLVALRDTAEPLGVGPDDPRVVAARDAYLGPWGGPTAANLREAELAQRLGVISRAVNWLRGLQDLDDDEAQEFASAPTRWLGMLVD